MFSYCKYILAAVIAAGLTASVPASAESGCPDGSSEVVIDTGTNVITTCASEEIVESAEEGAPITLAAVVCSCDYATLVPPRKWRNYDADPLGLGHPSCSLGDPEGSALVGSKLRPIDGRNATINIAFSGVFSPPTVCFINRRRKGTIFLQMSATLGSEEEETACRVSLEAYRAAIALVEDAFASLSCPL